MKPARYQNENNADEREQSARLNPFQLCYFIYTIAYVTFCLDRWKTLGITLSGEGIALLSAAELIFTAAVLLYNRKCETRSACRIACYIIAAVALCSFVVYLTRLM